MQFLTALFGGTENTILTAALALGVVLVLILLGLWVLKFFVSASASMSRGRGRRLAVVDSVQIDPRRKVVIIRRDNVEHVIMTGGPQDLLVESGIAVERPGTRSAAQTQPNAQPQQAAQAEAPATTQALPRLPGNGPMQRLRDARSGTPRKAPSLRNSSLLRPVDRDDPAVIPMNGYNPEAMPSDSATTSPNETNGQAKLGAASTRRYPRDAFNAEGGK